MQASPEEISNVTPQSLARHCGLINDQSEPDLQSDEQRIVALRRQLGLIPMGISSKAVPVYNEFSATYLPALVALYKRYTTSYNIATVMINAICHLPYFIRYQKTPAASDLAVLHATRMANEMDESSNPENISETCQFFSTVLVLQGTTGIPEDVKKKLIFVLNIWQRRYADQFPGCVSDRCYQCLTGTPQMVVMSKMMKETLERPLNQCGVQECDRRVDSVGPELKQCSRCKSAVYCGTAHQKQHWTEHKKSCYPTTF